MGEARSREVVEDLAKARGHLKEKPKLLHEAIKEANSLETPLDHCIEQALFTIRIGRWVHLRSTTKYALLLDESMNNAYAVRGLTTPLHELSGSKSSIFEAAVFEYRGEFLCDGLIINPVHFGPGFRADLNDIYKKIRKNGRFHKRCVVKNHPG